MTPYPIGPDDVYPECYVALFKFRKDEVLTRKDLHMVGIYARAFCRKDFAHDPQLSGYEIYTLMSEMPKQTSGEVMVLFDPEQKKVLFTVEGFGAESYLFEIQKKEDHQSSLFTTLLH